ncbi:fertility inhibition factor FiwA [Stutzerimonas stutzeri B1SMN1]|nr:fertility inhibition factor FiwA [Salmonella enterica]EPL59842.1 fertility inhibition factor FiwA [Stutzerimonas stutzeri B1SMN1]
MFENWRRNRAMRAELRELDQNLKPAALAKPDTTTPGRLLWCLPVPGKPEAFMQLDAGRADHDRFVVPVNAVAFNRLWLAGGLTSPGRPDGCPLRKDMPSDYKFRHAVAGFAVGRESPVPLASVALERGPTPSVRFNDGVTRTLWLLANNVAAFPVVIAGEDNAKALAKLAGTDGSIMRASEAFRVPEKAPQLAQEPLGTKRGGAGQEQARQTPQKAPQTHRRPPRDRGMGMD